MVICESHVQSVLEEIDSGIPLLQITDISLWRNEIVLSPVAKNIFESYTFALRNKWSEIKRKQYFKNRENLLPRLRNYYYQHRDTILTKQKENYLKNRPKILKRVRGYQAAHKESERIRHQKYYETHKENFREYRRIYYLQHKDKWKNYNLKTKKEVDSCEVSKII